MGRVELGEPGAGAGEVGSSSLAVAKKSFPPAAQPEIMRAAEKDNHYASYVHDACRDAIRHLFGTRAAVAYQSEEGDVLAYRLVELSSSWTPELSSFPVGKVSSYDPISKNVILLPVPNFPVFPDKEKEEEEFLWQTNVSLYKEDGSLEIDYASLMDVRVFKPNKQLVLSNNKHGNMTEET